MPKRAFNILIKRDIAGDFNYHTVGYYRLVILGGGILAALITVLIKIIFY
jgi:hypothetical protein